MRVGASEIAQHRDGISLTEPMVVVLDKLGLFNRNHAPAPDDYATTSQLKVFSDKLDSTPAFLWISTEGNDRVTQVNAGRTYARVQLAATAARPVHAAVVAGLAGIPGTATALCRHSCNGWAPQRRGTPFRCGRASAMPRRWGPPRGGP